MRIGIVQASAKKGAISLNIKNHLNLIKSALPSKPDLIVFPELSIIGYEPELAEKLACTIDDERFNSFQVVADTNKLTIGIGMPTQSKEGINISMLLFRPHKARLIYSKQLLHADELPYFVSSNNQVFLIIKEKKIAFGICYETLQREHFIKAVENKADIYIASVAKPERGNKKAYVHFSSIAKEFKIPILMSNCVGYCDNFMSNGKSAAWNKDGKLVAQLGKKHQGLLIYETESEEATILQIDN
ncbi:carbon-nitrogen hydrolase family protein [Maribacter aestuarii]|uniref:carbon-nitrogen hydrolase family protein n=1 Tax=Maribacter aestuarii TaxID=1130723 RepID=UPI00248C1DEC|nr:carbon-nitrogen hydrolase family protein [Maribacter aestuarii]